MQTCSDSSQRVLPRLAHSRTVLLCVSLVLAGCETHLTPVKPSIEITQLPDTRAAKYRGLSAIAGRVTGFRRGQRVVVFAKSGLWWAQPFSNDPFTAIQPDATWQTSTHPGTEYAALLVDHAWMPPPTTDELPLPGGSVVAVAIKTGIAAREQQAKKFFFGGYEWQVRDMPGSRPGTMSDYDPANAWTDARGRLHLRISRGPAGWAFAEISLDHSLGYGTYTFVVRQTGHLEPAAVLGIYTWDELAADENYREMDIEITRWGDPLSRNAQYAIQPYYVPANVVRFTAPQGVLTHSLRWSPGRAEFTTFRGASSQATHERAVADYSFTSGVPSPGREGIHLSLYAYGKARYSLRHEAEVIIDRFEYLP